MIPHARILRNALNKTRQRNGEHGDSWKEMSLDSLFYAAIYKLERARCNHTSKEKILDDLSDSYNYIAAIFERVSAERT